MSHSGAALIDPYIVFEKISLSPGMRVADLGCGRTGHFVFAASRVVGEHGMVYAVEIVKNILDSIKSRVRSEGYHNVQPLWSNIELFGKTPIPEGSVQASFLVNVLFLVQDKPNTLREAARLVAKDGAVVVVDWAKRLGPVGPAPETMVTPGTVTTLAAACGLSLVEEFPLSEYHYCLIFKK